jgi:hypothetical protein
LTSSASRAAGTFTVAADSPIYFPMRLIAIGVVYAGLPGFLLGLALGLVVRRWVALAVLAVVAAGASAMEVQRVSSGSSGDNDPRIIVMVALVANLIGFLVGAAVGRRLADRGSSASGKPS